jgi:hypothetical protein
MSRRTTNSSDTHATTTYGPNYKNLLFFFTCLVDGLIFVL